jgi:ribonuclease HII
MRRALAELTPAPDHVLVDGLEVPLVQPHTAVVKGDALVRSIAAASVVAKVARDALMRELDVLHPGYELAGNKGYGSTGHLEALSRLGPSSVHRLSFSPCGQPPLF